MKLGILCTMTNSFGRKDFYNIQELGLARALVRQGHSVVIYKGCRKDGKNEETCTEIEPGLLLHYIPIPFLGAHGYMRAAYLDKTLDGILCFADNQVCLPHLYSYCRRHGICFVPYIGVAHSYHSGLRQLVMDSLFKLGSLRLYRKLPVIAKTESAREEIEKLGVTDIRIANVGLDEAALKRDFRSFDRDGIRRQFGFEADDVVLLNVARLEEDKHPEALIEIMAHISGKKRFKLLLIGEGPLRAEVDKLICEHGLEDIVKIIDRVPYARMWESYYAADYYLNLSKDEIFGMAVLEAVYYETSVAAMTAPGPRTILNGMAGHCLCEDNEAVEKWLLGSYPPAESLAESSRKLINKFNWNPCASAFTQLVESAGE